MNKNSDRIKTVATVLGILGSILAGAAILIKIFFEKEEEK